MDIKIQSTVLTNFNLIYMHQIKRIIYYDKWDLSQAGMFGLTFKTQLISFTILTN